MNPQWQPQLIDPEPAGQALQVPAGRVEVDGLGFGNGLLQAPNDALVDGRVTGEIEIMWSGEAVAFKVVLGTQGVEARGDALVDAFGNM